MDKVLVAGGAGFIGSNLCKELVNISQVYCLDNFVTGFKKNISELLSNKNFTLIEDDVIDFKTNIHFDYIYHLASPASPPYYQKYSLETFNANVYGSNNLLKLAKNTGARILFASTSEVYGDPLEHPQSEKYWGNVNPIGIRSCYDESKRAGETLFYEYHKLGVDACIVRIFNTYGENMDINDGRVVSNFITQALTNKDITIYGDGNQTRSLCYVKDTVRGIISMAKSGLFDPVNIGNPTEITINEFAKIVKDMTNTSSNVIHCPLPENDPTRRKPDISRAISCLKWQPKTTLKEGLLKIIKYYEEELWK